MHDILTGNIPACKQTIQAVERQMRDLKEGPDRGLYFDELDARMWVGFFESFVRHYKGDLAGQLLVLSGWQHFYICVKYGWKRDDGTRRFRESYLSVARKNGKTFMLAGEGLAGIVVDNEPGAEVYSAATKKDQARISHADAIAIVQQDPMLSDYFDIKRDTITHKSSRSKFEPLTADGHTMDGLHIHMGLLDELHAHPSRLVYDKITTATGARRQPMISSITTAGDDTDSLCFEIDQHARAVLSGSQVDDSFFTVIYTLDEGDDWRNEENWVKANPNLGVSKYVSNMRDQAAKAESMPSSLASFKQLELNMWVQSLNQWLDGEKWAALNRVPSDFGEKPVDFKQYWEKVLGYFKGKTCHAAVDLSSNKDTTALVLVFKIPEMVEIDQPIFVNGKEVTHEMKDFYYWVPWFWLPSDGMKDRIAKDKVDYRLWARYGCIELIPGEYINTDFVLSQAEENVANYQVQELAYDNWGSATLRPQLAALSPDDDWLKRVPQNTGNFSPVMKSVESMVLSGQISHLGNPVLKWMGGNVTAIRDSGGNIRPDKRSDKRRIDGIVAGLMAMASSIENVDKTSVYSKRGVRVI